MPNSPKVKMGLVLTGGGARAAYQVGAITALADLTRAKELPFQIVTGVSAGAINSTALASGASDFQAAAHHLWDAWAGLKTEEIVRTDTASLFGIGSRWIRDLSFGGVFGSGKSTHLLDTDPLARFLSRRIDFDRIPGHINSGLLHGTAVTATNYFTGTAVTFFDGHEEIKPWFRGTRIAQRETLTLSHVMASSAIPMFFPPILLDRSYYGDGCLRLSTPLSPAIHMGSERVLAIGIRYFRSPEHTYEINQEKYSQSISMVDIAGVILNSVFLDSLETDLERMERINRTLQLISEEKKSKQPDLLRHIPVMAIKPSQDLGTLASEQFHHFPRPLRHLLRGIGASDEKGWDLLSYLAFDSAYTTRLLDLGYRDAMEQKEELANFLKE